MVADLKPPPTRRNPLTPHPTTPTPATQPPDRKRAAYEASRSSRGYAGAYSSHAGVNTDWSTRGSYTAGGSTYTSRISACVCVIVDGAARLCCDVCCVVRWWGLYWGCLGVQQGCAGRVQVKQAACNTITNNTPRSLGVHASSSQGRDAVV